MQTVTTDPSSIKISPTTTSTTSLNAPNSFLFHEASRDQQTFVRPVSMPRSAASNGGAKIVDTPDLNVEEKDSKFALNQLAKQASKNDPSSLRKSTRQSDVSLSDEANSSGSLNDILTGLLNVVGEGLSIATNYVREENKRKKASQVFKCVFILLQLLRNIIYFRPFVT